MKEKIKVRNCPLCRGKPEYADLITLISLRCTKVNDHSVVVYVKKEKGKKKLAEKWNGEK